MPPVAGEAEQITRAWIVVGENRGISEMPECQNIIQCWKLPNVFHKSRIGKGADRPTNKNRKVIRFNPQRTLNSSVVGHHYPVPAECGIFLRDLSYCDPSHQTSAVCSRLGIGFG
jgi:hypothetical protein